LEALAGVVRRLHEQGFVHGDLYWRNILLSGGATEHFYLIDAHRGRRWRNERRGRALDLAALDGPAPWFFRRTERLRFFLAYRQRSRLTSQDKALVREALRLAEPLRLRQLRRVREAHR
jgi:tRNA A-37 threonylcarbamoyl transferase component Bud32